MTPIAFPDRPGIATITWKLEQPTQVNRSEFTGRRRVTILAVAPRWSAEVEIVPIIGEAAVRPWRSFFAQLRGQAGQFRLVAVEGGQDRVAQTVMVDGGGQTGSVIATRGWFPQAELREGSFVTIADQLVQLTAPAAAGDDGKAVLHVMPIVRPGLADGAAVETNRPWALVSLTDDTAMIAVALGQRYTIKFSAEESF